MSRATLPGPISPSPAQPPAAPPSPPRFRAGRANLRQAYDLALTGGLGALFGLYLYVEMVQAESVYVRDALAGLLIGGSLGVFLNAYGPFRDGAWLKLARAVDLGSTGGGAGRSDRPGRRRGRDRPVARRAARAGRSRGPCWGWGSAWGRAWPTDRASGWSTA